MADVRQELALELGGFLRHLHGLRQVAILALDLVCVFEQLLLRAFPLQRIANGAFQQARVDVALHQVIGRAGFHGLHVRLPVVGAG
jgi:hypothetical protein